LADIWDKEEDVPYTEIATRLFAQEGRQEMIPFLGAGVSVSARTGSTPPAEPGFPSDATMGSIFELLQIPKESMLVRAFLEYAVRAAMWMQQLEPTVPKGPIVSALKGETYPPYAWELSVLLSERASYTQFQDRPMSYLKARNLLPEQSANGATDSLVRMFKVFAEVTGLTQSTDPLTSIAEFHQYKTDRDSLRTLLADVFKNKVNPTKTHELVARAAKRHLANEFAEDYLIITTNYDALMEKALDAEKVPYVVITVDRKRRAHAFFSGLEQRELDTLKKRNPPVPARQFVLNRVARTLAIVFKMHGCLNPAFDSPDGIIITEADYVSFISNLEDAVPAAVGALLPNKRLLFLGYSFSDWNIRSVYESMVGRANTTSSKDENESVRDYAVTRMLSRFEQLYFKQRNIGVILQDLGSFTSRISSLEASVAGP
jgi:hypothetical protein